MGGGDVFDELRRPDQVADAPAGAVEVFAGAADGQGDLGELGGEGGDAGEGDVVEAVVDLVGEDQDAVFQAEVADAGEFGSGEYFADRVVGGVEDDHFGFGRDGGFEFGEVDAPVGGGGGARPAVLWGVEWDVFYGAAGHFNVVEILVEEGFEDDDFIAWLDEAHECAEHAWVRVTTLKGEDMALAFRGVKNLMSLLCSLIECKSLTFVGTSGDRDFAFGIKLSPKEWGIGIRDRLLQSWASLATRLVMPVEGFQSRDLPLLASTGCIRHGPMQPLQHLKRIEEDCSHYDTASQLMRVVKEQAVSMARMAKTAGMAKCSLLTKSLDPYLHLISDDQPSYRAFLAVSDSHWLDWGCSSSFIHDRPTNINVCYFND